MKQPDEVLRLFNKADDEMLQQADVKLSSFLKNKSAFVARFPKLADPFASDWADAIKAARNILPDYASVAEQSNENDALEILMDEGRNLFQMLMLYTQLAFPNHAIALRSMGQSQYESSSRSHLKLPILLRKAYKEASKAEYKEALLDKGMTEPEIEMLNTLADKIENQDTALQNAKEDRSVDANERIIALNTVWEKMGLVCQCAKLVFQKDATRYAMFLLSENENKKPGDNPPPSGSAN